MKRLNRTDPKVYLLKRFLCIKAGRQAEAWTLNVGWNKGFQIQRGPYESKYSCFLNICFQASCYNLQSDQIKPANYVGCDHKKTPANIRFVFLNISGVVRQFGR